MAYRLKPGQSVDSEIRRIAGKQLQLALAGIRTVGSRKSDETVHEARRHVKKIRALIRLAQPALGSSFRPANRRLRAVNRMLAPIADGEAVIDTLERLETRYRHELARPTFAAIRASLINRGALVGRQAKLDRVLQTAAKLLRAEQQRVPQWRLDKKGFRTIARGLEKSVRGAKRAMTLALVHPTIDHYHSWRRRVKDHWFQVRLLQARCGDALGTEQRRLEALDNYLGELHNCALLQSVLVSGSLVSRQETAHCLRLLRRYQAELRRQARNLGTEVYQEKPRQFVKRVSRLWQSAKLAQGDAEGIRSWRRAA